MQILLNCGIASERAIKSVGFFADPEQVAIESAERMAILYPTDVPTEQPSEVIEVEE